MEQTSENIKMDEDPFYSSANIKRLEKAIAELNAGYGEPHELVEVDSE